MSALTVTLGADITALQRALAGATELVAASARRMGKMTGAGLAGLGKGGAAALEKGFAVSGIALKAGIGAALAGGAAAVGIGVKAVNQAADFEQTKVAFTTLIGDAAKAEQTLAKLRKFSDETPFQFPEVSDAARKLIAFGESANTVPATLRRIGDVSAGIQAPIGEIAEIYGKARVQGRLFAEDVNQLTGRGIPIIGELAKQFGVNESQVRKLVESGVVGFPQIEKAFIDMTGKGGKFSGMMEAQSKTTKGLFSTLMDSVNGVFLALGTPINDAIRPLVAEAIDLVSKLTPLAVEAGKRIKDAIMFVITAFKSGLVLDLVSASLKLGFAVAINSLINGFRAAVSFLFYFISDGSMWKGLGTVLLGLAASFGLAILNAFEMPIAYLKAGIEWCVAWMLKGLAKVPGMSKLMGFESQDVNTNFGDILKSNKAEGGSLFGVKYKDLQQENNRLIASGGEGLGKSAAEAARKAGEFGFTDTFDTTGLKNNMDNVIQSIRDAMPKPEEVKQLAKSATKTGDTGKPSNQTSRLDPIVTSLGKVGGGGYDSGTLDAQRENNRLTGQTNELLKTLNKNVGKLGSKPQAAFG
ncbi:MAG: tape measure protein [Verrucomicrobiota bacterium]